MLISSSYKLSVTELQGDPRTSLPNWSKVGFSEHYLSGDMNSYFEVGGQINLKNTRLNKVK